MDKNTLPCIVCKKNLKPATPFEHNQPHQGLEFTSLGHYGGTIFDPMDGSSLAINVCDDCLLRAGQDGHVLLCQKPVVAPLRKMWKPERPG